MNKNIKFDFGSAKINEDKLYVYEQKLKKELSLLRKSSQNYDDDRASINLSEDKKFLNICNKLSKKFSDATTIIVIGIGGSNLGTMAVNEAINGKYSNFENKKEVYFLDTVDPDSFNSVKNIIEKKLKKKEKIVINAISKSGGTTETISNFHSLISFFKNKAHYDFKDYVVITTQKNSAFEKLALKKKYNILHIPSKVGGRYSVFSNVGLFPLSFLNIDTKKLLLGAKDMKDICMSSSINKNPAMKSAIFIFDNYKKGKNIFNTFFFSNQLEYLGKWYRQLLAESIGKEYNIYKKKVNIGITPIISIGSTDLHSMAQLYLGGPLDKIHCLVNIKNRKDVKITKDKDIDEIVPNLSGKKFNEVLFAIYQGLAKSFSQKKIPFYTIEIQKNNEYNIGALLQMKMFEIIYLSSLLEINPFDQPNVEDYKKHTRNYLKGGQK